MNTARSSFGRVVCLGEFSAFHRMIRFEVGSEGGDDTYSSGGAVSCAVDATDCDVLAAWFTGLAATIRHESAPRASTTPDR